MFATIIQHGNPMLLMNKTANKKGELKRAQHCITAWPHSFKGPQNLSFALINGKKLQNIL
jgi:hypothetical protein